MEEITLRFEPLDGPAGSILLDELDADLAERYGNDDAVTATAAEFLPPEGAFAVLYVGGEPHACGGFRRIDGDTAELKRMYVRPGGRGRGLARRVLAALETAAAQAGYRDLWLETGLSQPEAIQLYVSSGYTPVPTFGQFAGFPSQRTYGKALRVKTQ